MDAHVAQLADALEDLAQFLRAHREPFWAGRVGKDAARVRRGDGYGVTHFLSAFGGMGSLNDLCFHPSNGNASSIDEGERLQQSFDSLQSKAWQLATWISRATQD